MGEEITATEPPRLKIRLRGTAPWARVTVVKDGQEVQTFTPEASDVDLEWADLDPRTGSTSHYYVRGEQSDGELVWTSPIWVTYEGAS